MHRAVEDLEFTLPECGNQRSSRLRMHGGSSPAVKAKAAEQAASRRGTGADAAWVDPREVPVFKSQLLKQAGTLSKMAIDAKVELESAARRAHPEFDQQIAANDDAWRQASYEA